MKYIPMKALPTIFFTVALPVFSEGSVTYFEKPPTASEVMQALHNSASNNKTNGLTGRGIEWTSNADTAAPSLAKHESTTREMAIAKPTQRSESTGTAVAVPINFDVGSSQISATSLPYLEAVAGALASDPGLRLTVEGHTDSSGDPRMNLMLSWERAFSVFRALVRSYNIDPARLQPEGKGSSEPIAGAQSADPHNRRVQFRLF